METKHISINRGILIWDEENEENWSGAQIDEIADYAVNWLDSDAVSSGGFIETYRFRSSSKILVITLDSRLQIDGDYFRELIEVIAEKLSLEVNSTDLVRQVREAFYKI